MLMSGLKILYPIGILVYDIEIKAVEKKDKQPIQTNMLRILKPLDSHLCYFPRVMFIRAKIQSKQKINLDPISQTGSWQDKEAQTAYSSGLLVFKFRLGLNMADRTHVFIFTPS